MLAALIILAGAIAPAPAPPETLADAIERAYRTNPTLSAARYDQRATDEELAQARALLRATTQVELSAGYDHTVAGRTTQAGRPLIDQLLGNTIDRNDVLARLTLDQPLWTGGRATAAIQAAEGDIRAGRAALRGSEGDLLANVISTFLDVRRDMATVEIRRTGAARLAAITAEVEARREAGELTRTDVAQSQTQLEAARVALTSAEEQLEASRATFATLTGAPPGILAPPPPLPLVPNSIAAAYTTAGRNNPELERAIANEAASRARIAQARAERSPTLSVRGTAQLAGKALPYVLDNQDQGYGGRVTLTIPLTQGGRVGSAIAQAEARNAADRLRVDVTERDTIEAIRAAWNAMAAAGRNVATQRAQLAAAQIYVEGMGEEYREGLRSTFDVLFAENSLRDTQVALLASERDAYVAQAILLRRIGELEASKIMTGTWLYDPSSNTWAAARRGATPFDPLLRAVDRIGGVDDRAGKIVQSPRLPEAPLVAAPAMARPTDPIVTDVPPVLPR